MRSQRPRASDERCFLRFSERIAVRAPAPPAGARTGARTMQLFSGLEGCSEIKISAADITKGPS